MDMEADRRRWTRFEPETDVKLSTGPENYGLDATLVDASLGGLGFECDQPLEAGRKFDFRLDLPGGSCRGTASVRWLRPYRLGWRCGAKILRLSYLERWRLRSFLQPRDFNGFRLTDRLLWLLSAATAVFVAIDWVSRHH